jgi:hypothetical protein
MYTSYSLLSINKYIIEMKATGLSTRLGRLPAGFEQITAGIWQFPIGFCVNMLVGENEYQTTNKPANMGGGTTEWLEHIYLRVYSVAFWTLWLIGSSGPQT